ncbi:MAG TPA: NAD-dependent protein deacetylase [Polyangiaceae bacterium]|jgi:NAD-dependent SIR2 family protein deacetylase|nr:NAD-dependent protein deacetylase [Polyangiaceae bacterium]
MHGVAGEPAHDGALAIAALLRGKRVAALTGAGLSTESGIPDYRGPGTRDRARNPIQHREFVKSEAVRTRYWARAVVGWERFSAAAPNAGHFALAELERAGVVVGVITQNVDRLHHAAGSRRVIELHGALAEVRCLDCGAREARAAVQRRLLELNPGFDARRATVAPDGDADLPAELVAGFRLASCIACGGMLKPDVVMFGDNVPKPIVDAAFSLLDEADVLLVLGTSLAVWSGYRFVRRAEERGMPIAMVNLGESRGDAHATVRVEAGLGATLPLVCRALGHDGGSQ